MARTVGMGVKPSATEEEKKLAKLKEENKTLKAEVKALKAQLEEKQKAE